MNLVWAEMERRERLFGIAEKMTKKAPLHHARPRSVVTSLHRVGKRR